MKRNGPGGFEKEASAKYTKKGTNMNRKELSQNHWKYYLMLEKRFVESIEFVELHEDNFDAFSNGYALLIQAIGAELDTVFKEFCGFNTTDRKTVADYAQYILTNTPDIKIKNQCTGIRYRNTTVYELGYYPARTVVAMVGSIYRCQAQPL